MTNLLRRPAVHEHPPERVFMNDQPAATRRGHAMRRCGAPIEPSRGTTTLVLDVHPHALPGVPGACLATAGHS